jgi:nucleoside-diphosphate-sugar epimerase
MKLAVWGATGHVGKALTSELVKRGVSLDIFVRDTAKGCEFLHKERLNNIGVFTITDFDAEGYNGVINCIGIGSPDIIAQYPQRIFQITEEFDALLIKNAIKYPKCVFVNISSGAVYGTDFENPASKQTISGFSPNELNSNKYYGMAKLYSETKHRANAESSIIDLRMFAFFSRFIDIDTRYFMTEICQSILNKTVLKTSQNDFTRDFIHPFDLTEMVMRCVSTGGNAAYDLYSAAPVTKWDIIHYFEEAFGLRYALETALASPTGEKNNYYSVFHSGGEIGYQPRYTSLESLSDELHQLISEAKG